MTSSQLFTRLVLFALVVGGAQLAIGTAELPEALADLREALHDEAEVLFLADSTNRAYARDDADRRPISELLQERLDGPRVVAVDHAAWNPDVYLEVVSSLRAAPVRPRAMVFAVNVRSFLPAWVLRPGWQFERERFTLRHPWLGLLWQPLAVFKAVDATTVAESAFRSAEVRVGTEVVGTIRDHLRRDPEALDTPQLEREDLQLRLTANYLEHIAEDSPRLDALRRTAALCEELGIEALFYVTPVDVQTGEELLPGRFEAAVTRNARLLTTALRALDARVLDLSLSTPSEQFSWERIPNEHLDQRGKARVADALAAALAPALAAPADDP